MSDEKGVSTKKRARGKKEDGQLSCEEKEVAWGRE